MRLIDADKLLSKLEKRRGYIKKAQDEECIDRYEFDFLRAKIAENLHVSEVVEKMASEAVDPVKRGHWIEKNCKHGKHNIQCSACKMYIGSKGHARSDYTKKKYKFCYHCGAYMNET